jgi:glutamate dehydrogenase (NADP+)
MRHSSPLPTQNELDENDAKTLIANGSPVCRRRREHAQHASGHSAVQEEQVYFAPGKAANAGGVATSGLEMSQNSERRSWTFEEVDAQLQR